MPVDLGPEPPQDGDGERSRADAVDVVVAVDADAPPGVDRAADRRARLLDVAQELRVVTRVIGGEERPRARIVAEPAPGENACKRLAHAEGLRERTNALALAGSHRPRSGFAEHLFHKVQAGSDGILARVPETNYVSGDDYVVEFLEHRFGFNAVDFEQRVGAAAVKLGLVELGELDDEETADLVDLVVEGRIIEPRSLLGDYVVRHWERVALVHGESLVNWLRKLIFRSAWLDHRVKENLLEVAWDDEASDFGYRDPKGGRALLELAPVPSWHDVQFRRT